MADSSGLSVIEVYKLVKDQAWKIIPFIYRNGKLEADLLKFQATPLLKAKIKAEIETPLPEMLIAAFMRRFRGNKTREAIELRTEGNKAQVEDDWLLINWAHFVELTSDFEKLVKEEEQGFGSHFNKPEIIENYIEQLDEKAEAAEHADQGIKVVDKITLSPRRNPIFQPAYSSGMKDVVFVVQKLKEGGLEGGTSEQPDKTNPIFLPAYSSGMKDVVLVVQNLKEEGLEGGTSEQPDKIEQGATLIFSRQQDMDNFVEEREKLLTELEVRKAELMRQRYEEDVKLEKEFDEELARLIKKYQEAKQVSVRGRVPCPED